jgi:hypothetical protein
VTIVHVVKVGFAYSEVFALFVDWESPSLFFSVQLHQNVPEHFPDLA